MKKVKLGEVCEILNGFAFKSLLYVNEGIRIIRITNVQKGYIEDSDPKYYPIEYTNSIEKYILKENDLLMSLTGNVGRVGLISKTMLPAALNQRVACLRTIDSLISKEYVFQFLNSDLFEQSAIRSSNGVAQKNLSTDWLKKVEITYPSVEQQELITSTLNLIERLICCRKEQNKKLNELVKSRFNEMFGDPINNDKKFAVKTGQQCFKFSSGKFLDKNDRVFEGYPAYGGNGIAWKSRNYLIDNPTIIIGRVGAYCGNVRTTHGKVWISDNAIYIKEFKNLDFNLVFLLELMKVIDFSRFADFSGQPKITQKPLEKQKYILPHLALQNEFADFVAQVDKSQLAIQKSLEELETLKKSLMQEYFG
ncbi:restriction endonuclease subunit S [Streptococcus oralis]|uniref:restriction endonuclease subunit S n=1 Tax=Streptococcus oralis TaxID=1303 RepID=UPI001BAEC8CF|nr:restriction endonuclease subunit S [Streptococcus oralis]MBS3688336.1 restriction endonuclease subunit S [Streptococcus oralis]